MTLSRQEDIETACRHIYSEMEQFYRGVADGLGNAGAGYRILYGPPILRPRILFIGYQPGGGVLHDNSEDRHGWPAEFDYLHAPWPLAERMRAIFPKAVLQECCALNRIFLRAPTVKEYARISPVLRAQTDGFCRSRLLRLICLLKPQRIIFIGLNTGVGLFVPQGQQVHSERGRRLLAYGHCEDIPSLATIHLSGARISSKDRVFIAQALSRFAT